MKRSVLLYLMDIEEYITLIEHSLKDATKTGFTKDKDKKDATMRRLEIIGEAVKNLPDDFKKKYPLVEWKKIAGTRDVLTHAYFGVDIEKIWKVVQEDLPVLKKQI